MRPEEREGRDTESSGGSNGRNRSVGGLKREREREKKVSLSPLAPRRTDGKRKRKRRAESKLPPSLFFLASFLPLAASVAISHHSERKFSIHSMPPGRKKEGERLTERGKQEEDSTACEGNASAAKQSGATGRSAMAEGVVLYLPLSLSLDKLSASTRVPTDSPVLPRSPKSRCRTWRHEREEVVRTTGKVIVWAREAKTNEKNLFSRFFSGRGFFAKTGALLALARAITRRGAAG